MHSSTRKQKSGVRTKTSTDGGTGVFAESRTWRGNEVPLLDISSKTAVTSVLRYLYEKNTEKSTEEARVGMCSLLGMETARIMAQREAGLMRFAEVLSDKEALDRSHIQVMELFMDKQGCKESYIVQKHWGSGLEAACVVGMVKLLVDGPRGSSSPGREYEVGCNTASGKPVDIDEKGVWAPLLVMQQAASSKCGARKFDLLGYGPLGECTGDLLGDSVGDCVGDCVGECERECLTERRDGVEVPLSIKAIHNMYEKSVALKEAVAWVSVLQCMGTKERKNFQPTRSAHTDDMALVCQLDSLVHEVIQSKKHQKKNLKTAMYNKEAETSAISSFASVVPGGECAWQGVVLAVETCRQPLRYEVVVVFPEQMRMLEVHEWALGTARHLLDKTVLVDILQKRMAFDVGGGELAKRVVCRLPEQPETKMTMVVRAMLLGDHQVVAQYAGLESVPMNTNALPVVKTNGSSPLGPRCISVGERTLPEAKSCMASCDRASADADDPDQTDSRVFDLCRLLEKYSA